MKALTSAPMPERDPSELRQNELKNLMSSNKRVNLEKLNRKVFCIGLHKQGTSTLAALAKLYGYTPTHSTDWHCNQSKLSRFNFFSDGGSHYDGINEFDFPGLARQFPDSFFILQTRDPLKWIISKLQHAGWDKDTKAIEGDKNQPPTHNGWKEKSLLNIYRFLAHKKNYECKVKNYFQHHDPGRLLVADVTDQSIHDQTITDIEQFLGVESAIPMRMPHVNSSASRDKGVIPAYAYDYATRTVHELFKDT